MTKFLLMRHGQANFEPPNRWNTLGWGADLAPLTELGVQQVQSAIKSVQIWKPEIVLTSPMTRALQSASIITNALPLPLKLEFDLHEWVPDRSFSWKSVEETLRFQKDFLTCKGEWPSNEERPWETLSSIRNRVLPALQKYTHLERILVVCHAIVMYSLTNVWEIRNAELLEYDYKT